MTDTNESPATPSKAAHVQRERDAYGLMFHLVRAEEFFKTSLSRKLSHFERTLYSMSIRIAEGVCPVIASDWDGSQREMHQVTSRAKRICSRVGVVNRERFSAAIARATGEQA